MSAVVVTTGPGAAAALGAGVLQEPAVASPLPGGVATVVRFLFNLPAWFQIAGLVVGVVVALGLVWYVWRRRQPVIAWIVGRPQRVKLWFAGGIGAVVLVGAVFGVTSWNYIQHDNDFCTGCHVMGPAYVRFTESEHATLSCHACHEQTIFASMRQLYLWVAERPAEIGPHAKVPNAVCARCHVTGEPQVWRHIAATAGHRTHLESHAPALRGVQCVTCHAVEVHRFAPLDKTCGQAGCHSGISIVLGDMKGQTALHCTMCHRFTADVPALATRDSAAGTLVPGAAQCLTCHEMRNRVPGLDPARDPHHGTCGMCHKPHQQQAAAAARQTCASAGCHADWRDVPFHVGAKHRRAAPNCLTCHDPHAARVDASDCAGCHAAVRERRHGGGPPLPEPFDTTAALRRTSWRHGGPAALVQPPKGKGDVPPPREPPREVSTSTPADTFSHARHTKLDCIVCHDDPGGRGRLTFARPRGCQICHHQAPASTDCGTCHASATLDAPRIVSVTVKVAGHPARQHEVPFRHAIHDALRCVACHTTPVTLAPGPAVAGCSGCHELHHGPDRDCAACHVETPERQAAHAPPAEAHVACDACHPSAIVDQFFPDRAFCTGCHVTRRDHQPRRPCTVCHMQMSPDAFAERLHQDGGA